jgi:hypothetical protein
VLSELTVSYSKMTVFWDVAPLTDVPEVLTTSIVIALMMEAVSTSKTSVNFYETTWRKMPEESHLHTRRRENLKSHCLLISL